MGWGDCGINPTTGEPMGYGHEGKCHEAGCDRVIDHGLAHVCGGMHEGGEHGCGRYFCPAHLGLYFDSDPDETASEGLCCECGVAWAAGRRKERGT